MRRLIDKTNADIACEWDKAAKYRLEQITSGKDRTYNEFLIPLFLNEVEQKKFNFVLDIGCSVGVLTKKISSLVNHVDAIDISDVSINLAIENNYASNVNFVTHDAASYISSVKYDLIIANMFLMDCLYLDEIVENMQKLCVVGGEVLITIANPLVWPEYWGYRNAKWFNYNEELIIESDFRVTGIKESGFITTHIHRPLSRYIDELVKNRFYITYFGELTGYIPSKERIKIPRYLFIKCTRH